MHAGEIDSMQDMHVTYSQPPIFERDLLTPSSYKQNQSRIDTSLETRLQVP